MSQCQEVLRYLAKGESLTVLEAIQKLGVYALSQRCTDLRKAGWPIESEMIETPTGKRIARYFYKKPEAA